MFLAPYRDATASEVSQPKLLATEAIVAIVVMVAPG